MAPSRSGLAIDCSIGVESPRNNNHHFFVFDVITTGLKGEQISIGWKFFQPNRIRIRKIIRQDAFAKFPSFFGSIKFSKSRSGFSLDCLIAAP